MLIERSDASLRSGMTQLPITQQNISCHTMSQFNKCDRAMKTFLLSLTVICFFSSLYAKSIDASTVTITNNTADTLSVNAQLLTNDKQFQRGKAWDAEPIELKPYETKTILWFSRAL